MINEIGKNLELLHKQILSINNYIFNNPEPSCLENKCQEFLYDILKSNDFNLSKNVSGTKTSIVGSYGDSHPKIGLICFFNTNKNSFHGYANNWMSSVSIGTALVLKNILKQIGGSVNLYACGGRNCSTLDSLFNENAFDDIDAILSIIPNKENFYIQNSLCSISYKISLSSNKNNFINNKIAYNHLFSIINHHVGQVNNNLYSKCKFEFDCNNYEYLNVKIFGDSLNSCNSFGEDLKSLLFSYCKLINIEADIKYSSIPTNKFNSCERLDRLMAHNLKQSGIVCDFKAENLNQSTHIANLSNSIPTSLFNISICEEDLEYNSKEFMKSSVNAHAEKVLFSSIKALSSTAIDLISKPEILSDCRNQCMNNNAL